MKNLCFYHSADLDGHCAGAIVRYKTNAECYGINYNDQFPFHLIDNETVVWMVDFSLRDIGDMVRIKDLSAQFIWIDHHKTAIEALDSGKWKDYFRGVREIGKAGCELAWEYCFNASEIPFAVYLLGRYDVWDLKADGLVLPFQEGMRNVPETRPGFADELWRDLFSGQRWPTIAESGCRILDWKNLNNKKYMKATAFETSVGGLRIIAANVPMANSQSFDSVWSPDLYDAMCPFYKTAKGQWKISLFSDKEGVDVSPIMKAMGGGGHAGAAGCFVDHLPDWLAR